MQILISGATGLIGSALSQALTAQGHSVARLVRTQTAQPPDVRWNPETGQIDSAGLEGFDAVVHLAGESVAARWTPEKKARIRDSRVQGTRLLSEALATRSILPKVFISSSAIGYYGLQAPGVLREDSQPGQGFLVDVCQAWEAAAQPARDAGIRVIHPRFGIVLSPDGGVLAKMLLPFSSGLGGPVGDGAQYLSWITIDDTIGALLHLLEQETISGPVNIVAPEPVTNREFTQTLAGVLRRPAVVPLPAFAARLALGREAADEMLLGSQRVLPMRLQESGYEFRYPQLEPALRHLLAV